MNGERGAFFGREEERSGHDILEALPSEASSIPAVPIPKISGKYACDRL
jgi:hypothetical protein